MIDAHAHLLVRFEEAFSTLPFLQGTETLFKPLHHAFSTRGKRLRPLCSLIIQEAFSPLNEDSFSIAIALELFHNFTLIHDDIIDNSELRRGKPSVFHQYGLNASILSGDALLILAYQQIEKIAPEMQVAVLACFNRTAIEVCLGQQLDIDLATKEDVNIKDYIEMVRLKTAALIGCTFQMGGILAQLPETTQKDLYEIGENLGIAFQIQDDILDVYGNTTQTGKKNSADILNNKKTILYLEALATANEEEKQLLLTPPPYVLPQERIDTIIALYNKKNVHQTALQTLHEYKNACACALQKLSPDKAEKINAIIHYIMEQCF